MLQSARDDMENMGMRRDGKNSNVGAAVFCCCKVIIGLCLVPLGIAKIVVGAIYFHNCNLEPMIPIFLIVGGLAPLFFVGMTQGGQTDSKGQPSKACINFSALCGIIGFVFSLGWTIAGTIWVIPVYSTVSSGTFIPCAHDFPVPGCSREMCDKTLATFAFAMVIMDWFCLIFFFILIMCMMCACCRKQE